MKYPKKTQSVITIFFVIALASLLGSCKKNYTCNCSGSALKAEEQKHELGKMKKADAQDACVSFEAVYKLRSTDSSCSLSK